MRLSDVIRKAVAIWLNLIILPGITVTDPAVSIILPTYNRADTILRATQSVIGQTFQDWELLVVDDGSDDNTCELIYGLNDARIRLIRQENAGVYVARNNGLDAARGRWLAFLDSDDAWLPHFLELTAGFLSSSPEEHFVSTAFIQDYGDGHIIHHPSSSVATKYPQLARAIGSKRLNLVGDEQDDYLRVYQRSAPIGEWGIKAAAAAGHANAKIYSGRVFDHMRWGYLYWLPITVITRHALDTVGSFTTRTRNAADYRFLGLLTKHFTANMIAVPSAVKYERGHGLTNLNQDHLARGANRYSFEVNKTAYFQELFADQFASDPELQTLLCYKQMYCGYAALSNGTRAQARSHFAQAAKWQPLRTRAYALSLLAILSPTDRIAGNLLNAPARVADLLRRIVQGKLSAGDMVRKVINRLRL